MVEGMNDSAFPRGNWNLTNRTAQDITCQCHCSVLITCGQKPQERREQEMGCPERTHVTNAFSRISLSHFAFCLCLDFFDYLWRRGLFSLMCFPGGKRYSPGLRQKPWSPKRVCAGDTGNVWVIFFNVGSIICTTSTAENKEKLLSLKTLKAGLNMKNETERVITAFYVWKDWLHHPASVLYLHWGMHSEQPWKGYDSAAK